MSKTVLKFINDTLSSVGINYEFGEYKSEIVYPYFVGEYYEPEANTEDGLQESNFMLTGFARGNYIDLEDAKEIIERTFADCTTILSNGSGVNISYSGCNVIPTGDNELKRIEINLKIKEWKVNI